MFDSRSTILAPAEDEIPMNPHFLEFKHASWKIAPPYLEIKV
jgi:hypothetical protein